MTQPHLHDGPVAEAHPTLDGFHFLEQTNHMRVFQNVERRVLLAERRLGAPMPAEEVGPAHHALTQCGSHTAGWGVMIDTRPISSNNDPRFEAAINNTTDDLFSHFAGIVVLVRSTFGRLHATRLTPPGQRLIVTVSPEAGLKFLAALHAADSSADSSADDMCGEAMSSVGVEPTTDGLKIRRSTD